MSFGGEQRNFSHPEIKREGMDATMRIAMVGHKRVPSREGGIEVVVEELAARMVIHGHTVTCYNRSGHHVSGREYDSIERVFAPVKDDIYFIAGNGGIISYQGEIIEKMAIPADILKEVVEYVRAQEGASFMTAGSAQAYVERADQAFVKKLREGYKLHVNEVDDVLNAPETMTKVAMYNEEVDAAVGAEEAKRRFGDKIQIMASGDYWVDFVDVHSGKGNALQKLCNRLGITKREEVVAFGDNCNDVSMLLEAGKSYAVTTAREEAKQAARYVLEKPGPDSVLNVLKMILEL